MGSRGLPPIVNMVNSSTSESDTVPDQLPALVLPTSWVTLAEASVGHLDHSCML